MVGIVSVDWQDGTVVLLVAAILGLGIVAWREAVGPPARSTGGYCLRVVAATAFWAILGVAVPWFWLGLVGYGVTIVTDVAAKARSPVAVRPWHLPEPICLVDCWAPGKWWGKRRIRGELLPPGDYVRVRRGN